MKLGELFVELGVVGDTKELDSFISKLEDAKDQAQETLEATGRLLEKTQALAQATSEEEKALIEKQYAQAEEVALINKKIKAKNKERQAEKENAAAIAGAITKIGVWIATATLAINKLNQLASSLMQNNQAWINFGRQTNLGIGKLNDFANAASLLDATLGAEGAAGAVQTLNDRLFELQLTGQGAGAFQLAGINPIGQDAYGVLEQLRERFKGYDNNTATYLMRQLGLDPRLLPVLRMTKDEYQDLMNVVNRYRLTNEQREQLQGYTEQMKLVNLQFQYLKQRALLAVMPYFVSLMQSIARVTEFLARLIKKFSGFIALGAVLVSRLKPVQEIFKGLGLFTANLNKGIAQAIAKIPVLGRLFAGLGVIVSRALLPLTALYLIIDDIATYLSGGDSVIGDIEKWLNDAKTNPNPTASQRAISAIGERPQALLTLPLLFNAAIRGMLDKANSTRNLNQTNNINIHTNQPVAATAANEIIAYTQTIDQMPVIV